MIDVRLLFADVDAERSAETPKAAPKELFESSPRSPRAPTDEPHSAMDFGQRARHFQESDALKNEIEATKPGHLLHHTLEMLTQMHARLARHF